MSIWDNSTGNLVPPGTPQVAIRYRRGARGGQSWVVLADGAEAHVALTYRSAHLWCQNTYRLTSTPMTAVYQDYERARVEEYPGGEAEVAQGNPYRKAGQ